jgi:CelD/BcsL family acetyltransferase involved in cellulose biosynthesis
MRLHIEHCFQTGMQEFDFMAGEEGYKSHWTDVRRDNQIPLMIRGRGQRLCCLGIATPRKALPYSINSNGSSA